MLLEERRLFETEGRPRRLKVWRLFLECDPNPPVFLSFHPRGLDHRLAVSN
jgi:hypothetical protein